MLKTDIPTDKKQTTRHILKMGMWFAGLFIVGLLFKGLLIVTDDGKNPQRSEQALIKGVDEITKQNYKAAVETLTKAIRLDTTNADAYTYRGKAYFNLKEYATALTDLNKAIAINNRNYESYLYRADLYYRQEEYSSAFNDYLKSIEITPTAAAYMGSGNIYLKMGNANEAIVNYTRAIDLNANNAEFYYVRGSAYNQQGKYDEAIHDFNRAIELNPDNATYVQNRDFAIKLKDKTN